MKLLDTKKKTTCQGQSKIKRLPFPSDICSLAETVKLPAMEQLLLHVLRSGMNEKNKKNWMSQKTLALKMGKGERQVRRWIKNLKDKGIIKIGKKATNRRYGNFVNKYEFNYPWRPVNPDILNKVSRHLWQSNPRKKF